MSASASAVAAFATALLCAYALAPVAIRTARRTGFLDRPYGYKGHKAPTPYLGGAAVLLSMLLATLLFAGFDANLPAILGAAAALALLGGIDDRFSVSPALRIVVELAATSVLFAAGVHWSVFGNGPLDFALTALWVVGVVNAFNLMDNMDGACATVTAVSCAGIGTLALIDGNSAFGVVAFALTGACAGFLPRNLAGPARIFLGDGGSMPLGLLVAGLSMGVTGGGGDAFLVGAMLVGLPILDTTLVSVSRLRRGVSIVTAGRDHLTHRLLSRAGTPRRVCTALVLAQVLLSGLAVAGARTGEGATLAVAGVSVALGLGALVLLEAPSWRPASMPDARERSEVGERDPVTGAREVGELEPVGVDRA